MVNTKTPQQIKNKVEKGCGCTFIQFDTQEFKLMCGCFEDELCPKCNAKLSILTEYDKSINEMIEDLQIKYPFSALVLDKLKGELK